MNHPIHRVTAFEIVGPHTLHIRFENNVEHTIDFAPVLVGELFGPLRDEELFRQVRLESEAQHC